MLRTDDFDYKLPEELIAQHPPAERGAARMLVLNRNSGACVVRSFTDISEYITPDDCIVFNNTKVMNARFYGRKNRNGALIEFLLTMPLDDSLTRWKALLKPGKRVREGTEIVLFKKNENRDNDIPAENASSITVISKNTDGSFYIQFNTDNIDKLQVECGHTPLPPYIKREDEESDMQRYQTLFAKETGAVAAPTAGLHFSETVLAQIAKKGTKMTEITLHVGPGTFKPVTVKNPAEHKMHEESFTLSAESAEIINTTRKNGGRILAVGTTVVRVLETCADDNGTVQPSSGKTDIFLYPPKKPKAVDMLLTNFHLPKSTLLMLVSTFAEREFVMSAYETAKLNQFKFYSYGDCMLLV